MKKLTKGQIALVVIVLVLIIDQVVKIWVKTHMYIGQAIHVTDWFYIAFIENKTYGICRETGKLIPKERLRAVPHATLGIDAKVDGRKK